jgi:enediyne biosynthesis protein E4
MGSHRAWVRYAAGLLGAGAVTIGLLWAGTGCTPKGTPTATSTAAAPLDPQPGGPDWFEDVTKSSGIDFVSRNGEEVQSPHLAILESLGGGVALIDFDGDGRLDVYIPGGGYYAGSDNRDIRGQPGRLYRNLGGFRFADVTAEVGLATLADNRPWFYSHGVAVLDYDRDGWPELLVTGWGRIALFHNEPDGKGGRRFADVTAKAGLDKGVTWATSAAAADFDGDGYPDLYVCQYVDWSWANNPACNYDGTTPDVCPPKNFSGLPHKVYRNKGDGTFADVSAEAGLVRGGPKASKGLGVLAVDVNGDGKPDVYVANDTVDNFLYLNRSTPGRIRFEEVGVLAGVSGDGGGNPNGSMGVDAGDPEGVGMPYLWVTNYEKELHALYKNRSTKDRAMFFFHTPASGIAAIGQAFVGWGTGFVDADRDGWEDLFVANGHAIRYPTGASRLQTPVLLRNEGNGRFKDISPRGGDYFRTPHLARGVALGDLDNDGRVDVVVNHLNGPVAVLRNVVSDDAHWLGIELSRPGRADVVGARIMLEANGRKQTRFAKGGGSYASSPDRRALFGLGATAAVDRVTVIWPDGKEDTWTGLKSDRYYSLEQGNPEPRVGR